MMGVGRQRPRKCLPARIVQHWRSPAALGRRVCLEDESLGDASRLCGAAQIHPSTANPATRESRPSRFEYPRHVGVLRAVIAAFVIAFVPTAAWAQRVTKVPDGDTLIVDGVGKVHLLGIKSADEPALQ